MKTERTPVGFRLQYMEFMNWGTFNEKIWRIEPDGNNSLLTGAVGSGKSTVVDALTCLIVPYNKITFNKAAGAEGKERNLMSYIKGNYSSKSDDISTGGKAISLRYTNAKNTTFTVIIANFYNAGYDTHVSLAQLFWIENECVRKLLLISSKPLTIKEYFSNITEVRDLKRRLRSHSFIEIFDDNFSKYSQRFRQLFGMNSDKAIELFYQTVSMKSVSSLTSFVKEQMLERTDIGEQIEELKKRFEDLNKAYAAVMDSRKQRDILAPLAILNTSFDTLEKEIKEIDDIQQVIPVYFAEKKIELLQEEIDSHEHKLKQLDSQLNSISTQLEDNRDAKSELQNDIHNNGGARLEQIASEIKSAAEEKKKKSERYNQYQQLASACGLQTVSTEQTFFRNLKSAELKNKEIQARQQALVEELGKETAVRVSIEKELAQENQELQSLQKRASQIPMDLMEMRTHLAEQLGIAETEIPFAGELLKVRKEEKEWEGALERLLRGFGISMLVPDQYYPLVSGYVNASRLTDKRNKGVRLEYFRIPSESNFLHLNKKEPEAASVVNKIDIKPDSPFTDWLENELLGRFDLNCVSLEEFKRGSNVITREGQIKTGRIRHVKDDRRDLWDRRNFVLGWNNKEKIQAIQQHIHKLQTKLEQQNATLARLSAETKADNGKQMRLLKLIGYTDWSELNWQEEVARIRKLEAEKRELTESNNVLKTLEEQLEAVKKNISELEEKQSRLQKESGSQHTLIENAKHQQDEARLTAALLQPEEKSLFFPKIEKLTVSPSGTVSAADRARDTLMKTQTERRRNLSDKLSQVRDKIMKQIREYKGQYPSESQELSEEIGCRDEYLRKYQDIVNEGLPAHEARLKKMLNENTINDIVAFDNKLDIHAKQIQEKINIINEHLEAIEFNRGTYIKLLAVRNPDVEIKQFKADLKACYSNIMSTEDAYTEERFNNVQKILNRFRSNDNKDMEWTQKVTDVRQWFIFNASERYLADDAEKEFYAGTSGKSGGQKEKLAYTILASALAYQFGLSYNDERSKSFRFVAIDEAFGRGDDESTQFGLDLFKKLDLQLFIVTPMQKIHVIENYVRSVHYVSNIGGNNSQIKMLTVEAYKAAKNLYNLQIESAS